MSVLQNELVKLYEEYRRQMFTCAFAVTRCADLAEDAVHEAFARMFRLTTQPLNLKAYAFRVIRNAAIDIIRRRSKLVFADVDFIFDPAANPRRQAEEREFQQRVARAMLQLSDDERETIVQHLYADLTFREIAELRDTPVGTVTSWYRRGIGKMRDLLEEQ